MNRKIRTAAVIGSGVMGGGIAALLAGAGVKTLLLDIVPFDLNEDEKTDPQARNRIAKAGLDAVMMSRPALLMHKKDADQITIGNLEDDFDKLADCDWIVEVVVENLKIKHDLFKRIEGVIKPGTIVSSNTSGIPLAAMSEGLGSDFRQYFLGTHFFNPVPVMRLLEIIKGHETSEGTLEIAKAWGADIGKETIIVNEAPAFAVNRVLCPMLNEAFLVLETGVASAKDIDKGMVLGCNHPIGPLALSDMIGLDTLLRVMEGLHQELGEKYLPAPLLRKLVRAGNLGRKSGKGVYDYSAK